MKQKCSLFVLFAFITFALGGPAFADYIDTLKKQQEMGKIIRDIQEARKVQEQIQAALSRSFGMMLRGPIAMDIVSASRLDELYRGEYRGAEVGLYRYEAGTGHHIYMMTDMAKDAFMGALAHEMTHAWQAENCPPKQELLLKEGFANWVAYKVLQKEGAFVQASKIRDQQDPIYGKGFKLMLEWEDRLGEAGLVREIKGKVTSR